MKRILFLHRAFPVSISKYFLTAFRKRSDVDVVDVSPYYGSYIPWKGGMNLPDKYKSIPTYSLPFDYQDVPWSIVDQITGHQCWDMVLTIDPMIRWASRPKPKHDCPVVHVATDPHVVDYEKPRGYSDFFFNMQYSYSHAKDIYLPYAFSRHHFYPFLASQKKIWDASLVGLQYTNRVDWVNSLRNAGYNVFFDVGPAFDEYREITWSSRAVLSWSSKDDLICRVFEAMGMGVPLVSNYVPDMELVFGKQLDKYMAVFDGKSDKAVRDATLMAIDVIQNPSNYLERATEAKKFVFEFHTFDHRVEFILQTVFRGEL